MRVAVCFTLAALFGLAGFWCTLALLPWAVVGSHGPDYLFAALCVSPWAVAALALGAGIYYLHGGKG
jgi:hypothetical protein